MFDPRLCDPVEKSIENALDMANLFENLASNFAGVVQYNKDNSPHAKTTIDDVSKDDLNLKKKCSQIINHEFLVSGVQNYDQHIDWTANRSLGCRK